jgi:hypothetical protein
MIDQPLYVVEDYDEWRMEVHDGFIRTIDYYEEVVEIVFNVEV